MLDVRCYLSTLSGGWRSARAHEMEKHQRYVTHCNGRRCSNMVLFAAVVNTYGYVGKEFQDFFLRRDRRKEPRPHSHSVCTAAWSLCERKKKSAFSACTVKETFAARRRHRCNRHEGSSSCTRRKWSSSRRGASMRERKTGSCAMREKDQPDRQETPRSPRAGHTSRRRKRGGHSV